MTNSPAGKPDFYCCEYSEQAGEQLFGTATRVNVWLALEYTRPWSSDAFASSDIPEHIKKALDEHLAAIPQSRLQLIRQPARAAAGIMFFVAVSREISPILYKFQLDSYEDLLALDIPKIVAGDPAYARYLSPDPLFLVCVNGKKDISCAKYGRPVYDAMSQAVGEHVWQCTHLGGHRFAGTSVFLPHGLCYGRIKAGDVAALLADFQRQQIVLEHYRGLSYYDEPVQAADYYLRRQTGNRTLAAFRLVSVRQDGEWWSVQWQASQAGQRYEIQIRQALSPFEIYKNSAEQETTRVPQYHLIVP
jgi:hypothetical protein